MNKKLEYKNFDLRKVKLNNKKGLYAEFYDLSQKNDLLTINSDCIPHEDFFESAVKLKEILAKSLGLHLGWELARENTRKDDELLKKSIRLYNEEIERCSVTGFTMIGSDDDEGIKISGSLKCELGTVGLASPAIKFSEEEIGIGELASIIVEEIRQEVWAFIYKGKRENDLFNTPVNDAVVVSGLNNLKVAN